MKTILKIFAVMVVILGCAVTTSVEAKPKESVEMERIVLLTDIDCPSCEKKIMNVVPFQKGIKRVVVDIKRSLVTVDYNPKSTNPEVIKASLKRLGVEVKPEPKPEPKR